MQLGFFLMDTFGPKPGPFGKTTDQGSATIARTPIQQACKLGGQVLLQGFKVTLDYPISSHFISVIAAIYMLNISHWRECVYLQQMHETIRGEILEQVLNRLVTKTASPVSHYLGNKLVIVLLLHGV